ncbi:MAG: DNA repair protein RecN [Frankiaceae bacterium]
MRIRDLGVIEDASLEFAPGLTVLTGETGAGKTMVVQGLGLLLGARADGGRVRPGASRAVVEGRFAVSPDATAAGRALDAGAVLDDGALLVTRTVSAEGRSRAHLGGTAVPVAVLAELGADLVAVHGQSDQQRLLRPGEQRAVLDSYAGPAVAVPLAAYAAGYTRLAGIETTLAGLRKFARERAREADLLRFGLTEIESAAPQPGEDVELAATVERLAHTDALRLAASAAHEFLVGGDSGAETAADAGTLVGAARRSLDQQAEHDPALAALSTRIAEIGYLLTDVAGDLAGYLASLETDPAALAAASQRQATLATLTRKYGDDVTAVLVWAARAAERLDGLVDDDERIEQLAQEQQQLRDQLAKWAGQLSAARAVAAARFAAAVGTELKGLSMPHAAVVAEVSQRSDPAGLPVGEATLHFGPYGVDDVALLLQPHPGSAPRPLHRGASGGELSRVMLAVEVVLALAPERDQPVDTFVFDEVDAGVGGRAAGEVGRRLAQLAESAQVIVVTHLPQVAAYADRHLLVERSADAIVTRAGVAALDGLARVQELSRMLAGHSDSALARGHAQELLASAGSRSAGAWEGR